MESAAELASNNSPLEQGKEIWTQVFTSVFEWIDEAKKFVREHKRWVSTLLLILTAVIAVNLVLGVLDGINNIPLLEPFFQLIGVIVACRNLLFENKRQALFEKIASVKERYFGKVSTEEKASEPEVIPELPVPTATINSEVTNGVDELRYLFLASQVELLDANELQEVQYNLQSEALSVGVIAADGQKCDRCWNYSIHIGASANHPLICDRCVAALDNQF